MVAAQTFGYVAFFDIPIVLWLLKKERIVICFEPLTRKRIGLSFLVLFFAVLVQFFAVYKLREQRPNIMSAMYDRLSVCTWLSAASFHWGDVLSLSAKAFEPNYVPQKKNR